MEVERKSILLSWPTYSTLSRRYMSDTISKALLKEDILKRSNSFKITCIITHISSDPSVAKKDLNIILSKEKILLPPDMANSFVDIVEKDSRFFEENGIIDYSLLMGVHFLNQSITISYSLS